MTRIQVSIDRLVLKGFDSAEKKALVAALESELTVRLADAGNRAEPVRSHRTPVLRLAQMPFEPGPAGGRKLGCGIARAIGKGLKP
jgi:hypothetical protein